MNILAAVDGSPHSLAAVASLLDRLPWYRDPPRITLLHVHPPIPYKVATAWVGKETIVKYYDDESEAALAGARELMAARGAACVVEKRVGDPAEEIIKRASAGDVDLIVMGTHGHAALVNLVLGSVATKVLAASKVPVMFMKH